MKNHKIAADLIYTERISSNKTEALFLALAVLCGGLFKWRAKRGLSGVRTAVFGFFSVLFLFYSVNYRTLVIQMTANSLKLKFGLFTWVVPLENITACRIDELPWLKRMGGAGIHFMFVQNRYRASFNFLEYPRLVIALKRKAGPVQDISFSTRWPDALLRLIQEVISAGQGEKPGRTDVQLQQVGTERIQHWH